MGSIPWTSNCRLFQSNDYGSRRQSRPLNQAHAGGHLQSRHCSLNYHDRFLITPGNENGRVACLYHRMCAVLVQPPPSMVVITGINHGPEVPPASMPQSSGATRVFNVINVVLLVCPKSTHIFMVRITGSQFIATQATLLLVASREHGHALQVPAGNHGSCIDDLLNFLGHDTKNINDLRVLGTGCPQ